MLEVETVGVFGIEGAIHGMRNPMNSWAMSDSVTCSYGNEDTTFVVGANDESLAKRLIRSGTPDRKFLRMIHVQADVKAMQPWWSEFDTYKVATTRNSCSKMHKIQSIAFTLKSFTTKGIESVPYAQEAFESYVKVCEKLRNDFNATKDRKYWRALIEMLPEGYEMLATIDVNYETLRQMYYWRKNHKLIEWHIFCEWMENLPESWMITMSDKEMAE